MYAAQHGTSTTLTYADGYVEAVSDADKPALVTYTSGDTATISMSDTGRLQAWQNSVAELSLGAAFCDGQSVSVDCMPPPALRRSI